MMMYGHGPDGVSIRRSVKSVGLSTGGFFSPNRAVFFDREIFAQNPSRWIVYIYFLTYTFNLRSFEKRD